MMSDVKAEDIVAENESLGGAELSSAGWSAYEQLQIARKSVRIVYDVSFQRLLEDVQQSADDINEGACCDLRSTVYKSSD